MSEEAVSALLERLSAAARAESRSAAQRLVAIADLVALRVAEDGGARDDWAVDAVDAVTMEVSAELRISKELAASQVRYAHALRHQLPRLGAAFLAGDIDEATFRACVFRTGLIVDDEVLARVDAELAVCAPRWGSASRGQVASRIDKVVARVDKDAVRRRKDRVAGRDVFVGDVDNGLAEIQATVYAPTGHAVAEALTALAATVCENDPRTVAQRRADAFDALAARADRMACRCGNPACPAGGKSASAVVIHVIAEQATVAGTGSTPAAMIGYEGLIPAEVIAEIAASARLRPLVQPGDAPAEAGYVPSAALADFIRHRDLTCRFPGCDVPASRCDVDHVIPYAVGGPTQAVNLSCKCRTHHLLKTFWGWRDEQFADGTLIWTAPSGARYVTHPGSAVVFPALCVTTTETPSTERSVMMPRRRRTRAQERAAAITAERAHNHRLRTETPAPAHTPDEDLTYDDTFTKEPEPPPF